MSNKYKSAWIKMAPLGLTLIGMGVSIANEAAQRKGNGAPTGEWFRLGTVGLVVLNSGVSVFGDAVKQRTLYELSLTE